MKRSLDFGERDLGDIIFDIGLFPFIGLVISRILIGVVFAFLLGGLVMLLWNWLIPVIFGLPSINYFQGFGLFILGKLLFGGFHNPHHSKRAYPVHQRPPKNGVDENNWIPAEDYQNWKHYRQYWRERGKEDFQQYLNRIS